MSAPVDVLAVIADAATYVGPDSVALWKVHTAVARSIEALQLAEKTISDNLRASGYLAGSNVDYWTPEIRAQVTALVPIRAALARVGGAA